MSRCCKNYDPCLDGKLNQIGSYAAAARQSATNAAASEAAADADANAAASSATQANNYLTQITNIYGDFDERYLGAKDTPPTTDNEGNPLQEGTLYYNTVSNGLFVWNGAAWVSADFNEFTNFTATGTTFARNLVTRTADVINVKDFGAVGDGVADDTAAIQAALIHAQAIGKTCYIPSGRYLITSKLTISGNNLSIIGDGDSRSIIYTTSNITMLELDNTAAMNNGVISNIGFDANIGGARNNNYGIYVKSATTAFFAHWKFDSLRFFGTNICWYMENKPTIFFPPSYNVVPAGYITFSNWHTQTNAAFQYPDYGIVFAGGPGAHNTFSDLHISANINGIQMGDNVVGLGDQLIVACDFNWCDAGIRIFGPANITEYRERISVVNCQFDANSTNACHFTRCRDFRLIGNNLGAIEHILENCQDYQVDDIEVYQSRYARRKFNLPIGATFDIFKIDLTQGSNLIGFSSILLDVNLTGVCRGAGSTYAYYKYAIEWNGGAPTATQVIANEKVTGGIVTMSTTIVGTEVVFSATINSSINGSDISASIVVDGQFYRLYRL